MSIVKKKPEIHLFTATTMNGWKPIIFLEEAGVEYELTHIKFSEKEQKSEWYTKLNPNGRIPTIIDRSNNDFPVFESGAILWYLAEKYQKFLPSDANGRSQALQWMMFQMSGVGPMMGQAMYFQRIAEPQGHKEDFSIERFVNESRRLLEVLNVQLEGKSFVLGEEYTIVDIALYPWVRSFPWAKVSVDGLNHVQQWLKRLDARPAIRRAVLLPKPNPSFFGEGDMEEAMKTNAANFVIEK